jgi:hypothetical protein
MSAKKSIFRSFSTLLVLVVTLSIAGPADAVWVAFSKQAKAVKAAPLLQFTSGGHALGFTAQAMYAATGSHALHVDFLGARNIQPQADSSTNASNGHSLAAPLSRVSYPGLWDGIDLLYTAAAGGIYTSTYTLAPGADASDIRLRYNAPLALNKNGALRIAFETGTLTESAPIAWQDINGKRTAVDVAFQVRGQEVGFKLGAYNPRHALTIDPSVVWNTFLGGSGSDNGSAITVDGSGNIYVTGSSTATWGIPVRVFASNSDAFVAKLDAATGSLIWNAFLGGSGADVGNAITVDGSGNVVVTGSSAATWGTPVRAYTATGNDLFAAKLNSSGGLTWNTFLGGTGADTGSSITADGSGNVFVAGFSSATWGTPVRAYTATGNDALIAKLDSAGNLLWNTFLGANGTDSGNSIAVDSSGNVFVAGRSAAAWSCPVACTVRAYTSSSDAFVAKLSASTGSLTWNTFLGDSGSDETDGLVLDGSGNIYVVGFSSITWGSPVQPYTASIDAFVAKLDAASGSLTWNTFLGGSSQDLGKSIALDGSGNIYVSGNSTATWGSPLRAYTTLDDGFAAKINASGVLTANTFVGSSDIDSGNSIAVDGSGNVYVTGTSGATWESPVRAYSTGNDAFAAKLDLTPPTVISSICINVNPTNRAHVSFTVTFSETVTGVDTADFSLTTTGVTGASISSVTGSGATRTVTVSTGSGNGTIRLNVSDNDTIIDAASNPLGGAGAGNGNFTAGQVYTVNKILTFSSTAAQDGLVLESTETSNAGGTINATATTFNLGDDAARKQYRAILSFSTGCSIPDTAVITAVTLKVTKSSVVGGGNPVTGFQGFMADITKGFFGTTALQTSDFQATFTAATGKTVGPFLSAPISNVYSLNLTGGKTYINKLSTNGGLTQIRLRFKLDDNNNTLANYLSLFSGNAPAASRPQLVITYYVP